MCDPVTALVATSVALQVGGAVLGHNEQNQQADKTKSSALEALKLQDHELSLREVQERIAGKQQVDQGNREVQAASGDIATSAASRGVGGMSIDMLLGDVAAQGGRYKTSVEQNTNASVDQLEREKDQARAEAQSRINGTPRANPLATGLKIGGAVLDGLTTLKINRPKGV
jgi:hypothetical protein